MQQYLSILLFLVIEGEDFIDFVKYIKSISNEYRYSIVLNNSIRWKRGRTIVLNKIDAFNCYCERLIYVHIKRRGRFRMGCIQIKFTISRISKIMDRHDIISIVSFNILCFVNKIRQDRFLFKKQIEYRSLLPWRRRFTTSRRCRKCFINKTYSYSFCFVHHKINGYFWISLNKQLFLNNATNYVTIKNKKYIKT